MGQGSGPEIKGSFPISELEIAIMPANIAQQSSYAIGWGTLALINAGLAQSKNRSGIAWFLVSFLLGPLATFFIVISESVPKN